MLPLKPPFFFLLLLLAVMNISSCSRPDVTPPSVEPVLENYLHIVKTGNLHDVDRLYFIPLHWRQKQKVYKQFQKQQDLIQQQKMRLTVQTFKQKGRWAVAVMAGNLAGKIQTHPLWLFYYDARWQVVSPVIFKTAPVRSMMDLYREQKELRAWYEREQLQTESKK